MHSLFWVLFHFCYCLLSYFVDFCYFQHNTCALFLLSSWTFLAHMSRYGPFRTYYPYQIPTSSWTFLAHMSRYGPFRTYYPYQIPTSSWTFLAHMSRYGPREDLLILPFVTCCVICIINMYRFVHYYVCLGILLPSSGSFLLPFAFLFLFALFWVCSVIYSPFFCLSALFWVF